MTAPRSRLLPACLAAAALLIAGLDHLRLPRHPRPEPPPVLRLDLNHAAAAELDVLPGLGPARAARIIEYRAAHGPFAGVDDLRRVHGIGPVTVARLRPYLRTEPHPSPAP